MQGSYSVKIAVVKDGTAKTWHVLISQEVRDTYANVIGMKIRMNGILVKINLRNFHSVEENSIIKAVSEASNVPIGRLQVSYMDGNFVVI